MAALSDEERAVISTLSALSKDNWQAGDRPVDMSYATLTNADGCVLATESDKVEDVGVEEEAVMSDEDAEGDYDSDGNIGSELADIVNEIDVAEREAEARLVLIMEGLPKTFVKRLTRDLVLKIRPALNDPDLAVRLLREYGYTERMLKKMKTWNVAEAVLDIAFMEGVPRKPRAPIKWREFLPRQCKEKHNGNVCHVDRPRQGVVPRGPTRYRNLVPLFS